MAKNGNSEPPAPTVSAGLTVDHGQDCTLSTVTAARGQASPLHAVNGQDCTLSTVNPARGQASRLHAVNGHGCTLSTVTDARCPRSEMTQLNTLKSSTGDSEGEIFKRSTVLIARNRDKKGKKASPENTFLLDVGAMMEKWRKGSAKAELSGSGAWWRLAYRKDPDLMQRVLADTLGAVKEGRIKESPGQHAADLWTRWGGKCA